MGTCNRYDNLMWLSYVRGRLDARVGQDMESHCKTCDDCRTQLDFCRKIDSVIDLNSAAPPEEWTAEAEAQFALVHLSASSNSLFGDLVFDSYLHDREAVRSQGTETRHLVFKLPEFDVDLALEYSGRQLNMMMGQLLAKSTETPHDFTLELRVAERTYSAKPNTFGEFLFTVGAPVTGEPLELRCTFEEGPCAIVLIPC